MILADTCVLLDVVQADPRWVDWSQDQLEYAAGSGQLWINPIIYAEFSVGYPRLDQVDDALACFHAQMAEMPREALFLGGKAHRQYRQRGGTRNGVLPDFLIGAHAAVNGWAILTRDAARFRSYFPGVFLLTPE